MFNSKNKGFGFGGMPGFNGKKIGSISNGDYDRDGVKNKKDCDAFNFKKQGPEHRKFKCATWEACGSYVERDGDLCPECEMTANDMGIYF